MSAELSDSRVLGALRFTDAVTALPIDVPLSVTAPGVRWIRNRRAQWVIASAPGLAAHETQFPAPPSAPNLGDVHVSFAVSDPSGRWLSRVGSVALPRDPDSSHATQPASLFVVQDIPMYPTPAAPTQRGWAVVRASVAGNTPGSTLPHALVRVVRDSDGARMGAGMTDARGEALIAIEGIPSALLGDGDGPVVAKEIAVHLQVVSDPNAGDTPNPDDLETRHVALLVREVAASVASGRVLTMSL
jgi:hypothetical protein